MNSKIYLIAVFALSAGCLLQGSQELSMTPQPPKYRSFGVPSLQQQQPRALQAAMFQPQPQPPVVAVPVQQETTVEPPLKKRDLEADAAIKQPLAVLQMAYFGTAIESVIKNLMVQEEGKIWAAYYMATSESLMSWWSLRKYIQEVEKAIQATDAPGILRAEQYKTSKKDDILMVDNCSVKNKEYRSNLEALANSGVEILVRTKPKQPSNDMQQMHNKIMIFFHKDKPNEGKLVITGSFNLTNQASIYNWENIVILSDPTVVSQFIAQYNDLRQYCVPLKK